MINYPPITDWIARFGWFLYGASLYIAVALLIPYISFFILALLIKQTSPTLPKVKKIIKIIQKIYLYSVLGYVIGLILGIVFIRVTGE